jgi:hypothetical protein
MTNSELKYFFQKEGIESAHLDDIVHDAASSLASNANNEGVYRKLLDKQARRSYIAKKAHLVLKNKE